MRITWLDTVNIACVTFEFKDRLVLNHENLAESQGFKSFSEECLLWLFQSHHITIFIINAESERMDTKFKVWWRFEMCLNLH